jgi:hypothetical protein
MSWAREGWLSNMITAKMDPSCFAVIFMNPARAFPKVLLRGKSVIFFSKCWFSLPYLAWIMILLNDLWRDVICCPVTT